MDKPNITLSSLDLGRLERLIDKLDDSPFLNVDGLLNELNRADVVAPEDVPSDVVTMNSTVAFREDTSGREFTLTLVYPNQANSEDHKISVFAPVGSALLGMREGDNITWPKPGGGQLHVSIIKVTYQPEREGDFQH